MNKLLNWYFTKKSLPYWSILVLDSLIVFLSGFFAYWLFNRGLMTLTHSHALARVMLLYVALSWIGMRLFHTYSGILRYSSFIDLSRVAYANLVSLAIALAVHYAVYQLPRGLLEHINTRMLIVTYVTATAMMWAVRVLVKTLYDVSAGDKDAKRTLIYGALEGGVGLAKNIRSQKPARFVVCGFISHDPYYRHKMLMGEKVYTMDDDLAGIIEEEKIEAILISPLRTDEFRREQQLQDRLMGTGVKLYMAQMAKEWNGDDAEVPDVQIHEVSVEDLLPRDEIKVDMAAVEKELKGKRILITGAAGSIGSEIVRQVAAYRPEAMMLIDQAETPEHDIRLMMQRDYADIQAETVVASICNKGHMERLFADFKPDYVFHAAAYKHVPMMEDNPSEAVLNNVYGTKVIADLSTEYGVSKFVMVSTDKAVNPTNVMGCSKRICEMYVQALDKYSKTQFVTTRFGNVLGSNGSVIPLFKEQIRAGGPVTVTHPDIIRYFMLIPEACKLVLEAGVKGHGGEIFIFDMGKPVRIADLAKRMIYLSGARNIEIAFTGLRQGEKLYEEMMSSQEWTKPSFHKKIRIAKVREYEFDDISRQVDELTDIARRYHNMETVRKMKEIVPEYQSKNSVYEQLDK